MDLRERIINMLKDFEKFDPETQFEIIRRRYKKNWRNVWLTWFTMAGLCILNIFLDGLAWKIGQTLWLLSLIVWIYFIIKAVKN